MRVNFEEMPIWIEGKAVGLFWGEAEIDVTGRFPTCEWIELRTEDGGNLTLSEYHGFQLFQSAILKHYDAEIEEAIAEEDALDEPADPGYGRTALRQVL